MNVKEALEYGKKHKAVMVDLRFTDFCGTQRHFTIPSNQLTEASFEQGFAFDGANHQRRRQ